MRAIRRVSVLVCLAAVAPAGTPGQAPEAGAILAAARQALGGEKRLAAVRTFTATGRTRQVRGDNLVPIEFEIACQLPDKYVRKEEIPAQESGPTSTGFNGDDLIQLPPPPTMPSVPGGPSGPTPAQLDAARKARAVSVKQDFARLTLGMFATSFASFPLTFKVIGQAEAPQGKADVVEVKGPGTFMVRFFINSETHLPIMVSWTTTTPAPPAARGMVAPPAGAVSGPPAGKAAAPAPAAGSLPPPKTTEYRVYYADYRDVGGGVMFPFRLRRAVAGETVEETVFDGFRINAKIDAKKFEVNK